MWNLASTRGGNVWDPFREMERFQEEMGRLWRGWGTDGGSLPDGGHGSGLYSPRVDVTETEQDLRIEAELPGLDERDVEVALTGDVLTITGQKREERQDKERRGHQLERSYGAFLRSFLIPVEVDQHQLRASFKHGVLTVTLPKSQGAKQHTKRIAVTTQ